MLAPLLKTCAKKGFWYLSVSEMNQLRKSDQPRWRFTTKTTSESPRGFYYSDHEGFTLAELKRELKALPRATAVNVFPHWFFNDGRKPQPVNF